MSSLVHSKPPHAGLDVSETAADRPDAAELLRRASNAQSAKNSSRTIFAICPHGKTATFFILHHDCRWPYFACGNAN